MPRATANKLYRTFTKGLITEAGFLTYPENASTDELNTVIKVKGSRSRRLGIDYEPSSVGTVIPGMTNDSIISEFAWKAADNKADKNFLVVQVDSTVHFFDMDAVPADGALKSFTIDLTTYKSPTATTAQVANAATQMACGKGYLFIVSEFIEPILVDYDSDADTISVLKLILQIRDFDGVDDGLGNEDQPSTLSKEHMYNLRNQGWVSPGPNGVVTGAGTTNPYTPPAPPTTTTPQYIDKYHGFPKPSGTVIP